MTTVASDVFKESSTPHIQLLLVVIDLAGGTGNFCRTLAAGLQKYHAGEFVTSLLILRDRELTDSDHALFHKIHLVESPVHSDWRRLYETPLHALRLKKALKDVPTDLILTVSTYSNLLVPLLVPSRDIILSIHSNSTQQLRESRFGRLAGFLMRRHYHKRLVVGPTQGAIDDLRDNFGATRTAVIPHGIDARRLSHLADQPVTDLPKRPYAIAVGRLTSAKDYPTLLRAFAKACERGVAHDLAVVGEGELRHDLEALAADLKLIDRVHFLGHRANPYPYIQNADFFVLSSKWEGFGLALLEAMSLGLPAIATDCPSGPGEIVDDGRAGKLVAVGDVDAITSAIVEFSTNPSTRSGYAERSLKRAAELSLERMARAYRDLFRSALTRPMRQVQTLARTSTLA